MSLLYHGDIVSSIADSKRSHFKFLLDSFNNSSLERYEREEWLESGVGKGRQDYLSKGLVTFWWGVARQQMTEEHLFATSRNSGFKSDCRANERVRPSTTRLFGSWAPPPSPPPPPLSCCWGGWSTPLQHCFARRGIPVFPVCPMLPSLLFISVFLLSWFRVRSLKWNSSDARHSTCVDTCRQWHWFVAVFATYFVKKALKWRLKFCTIENATFWKSNSAGMWMCVTCG